MSCTCNFVDHIECICIISGSHYVFKVKTLSQKLAILGTSGFTGLHKFVDYHQAEEVAKQESREETLGWMRNRLDT